ncbi:hypothetical protein EW146_g1615 [Bondarzewia mesenterica]|uniref:Integrase core domain-containing protein n=1 Tax=Bondarzewia mesenterica TaxID=1095465 RepID=A0A4S4M5K4_9AGAM|nr:hypothetical protein EW146_g1615 [Bondarzewia mesenterica]
MPNPTGKNGHGSKAYPPDDIFRDTLLRYVQQGLSRDEKIAALRKDLGLSIGNDYYRRTTLNQHEKRLDIPSVRKPPPLEVATQLVLDEVEKGGLKGIEHNGPSFIKGKLKDNGVPIPRDLVRQIMLAHYPEGFAARFPGRKLSGISRQPLSSIGPFREISGDGHEKLGQFALQMGDISLPIYGFKDKWPSYVLLLKVIPNCRAAGALAHLFIDLIEMYGGISIQITTDKGSETGIMYAIQVAIRDFCAPDLDPAVHPEHVFMKSVHNTVIEAFWKTLKEKLGLNLKEKILQGKVEHIFNPNLPWHRDLFYWIFPPLVQEQLDDFRNWWNQHRIRSQKDKSMPSGHVPAHAFSVPEQYGGVDCIIPVSPAIIEELRQMVTDDVGPREEHLGWVTKEFSVLASRVYHEVGSPKLTLETSWDVFQRMSDVLSDSE